MRKQGGIPIEIQGLKALEYIVQTHPERTGRKMLYVGCAGQWQISHAKILESFSVLYDSVVAIDMALPDSPLRPGILHKEKLLPFKLFHIDHGIVVLPS